MFSPTLFCLVFFPFFLGGSQGGSRVKTPIYIDICNLYSNLQLENICIQ